MDQNGNLVGQELASGIQGQCYMDLQGDMKTDVGQPIEEVEEKNKIRLLRSKQ